MLNKCGHCRQVGYLLHQFDRASCGICGGVTRADGLPSVPTSALEIGGNWDGPGKELVASPDTAPWPARPWEE